MSLHSCLVLVQQKPASPPPRELGLQGPASWSSSCRPSCLIFPCSSYTGSTFPPARIAPSSVFFSNQARLRVPLIFFPLPHPVPKYPRKKETKPPCPSVRAPRPYPPQYPYPIPPPPPCRAEPPERHNQPGAPAPAHPTHLRGSKGRAERRGEVQISPTTVSLVPGPKYCS